MQENLKREARICVGLIFDAAERLAKLGGRLEEVNRWSDAGIIVEGSSQLTVVADSIIDCLVSASQD